jgi:lysophospholipase L1-like esterase
MSMLRVYSELLCGTKGRFALTRCALRRSKLLMLISVSLPLCAQSQLPMPIDAAQGRPAASHVVPFEAGDRIVFLGDSITSGGTYHENIRLFWATRFPDTPIHIWNKGIYSDFAHGGIKRIEHDTLEEQPNKVVINYGMNDSGASWRTNFFGMTNPGEDILAQRRKLVKAYRADMETLVTRLQERGVAPILAGPSIYDETMEAPGLNQIGGNDNIRACIEQLREISARDGLGFVDFNTPLLEINARLQKDHPAASIVGGDRVHPGPEGHWAMALAFLQAQGMDPYVAKAVVDAGSGTAVETRRCHVDVVTRDGDSLSFTYRPEALPLPCDASYQKADAVIGLTAALNRELIAVRGLKPGPYAVSMNTRPLGEFTAEQLAEGVNIATLAGNPGQQTAQRVQALVNERRSLEQRIRQLRQLDAGDLAKMAGGERETVLDGFHRDQEKARAEGNERRVQRWNTYFENLPQEPEFRRRIEEIDGEIYTINRPIECIIELRSEKAVAATVGQPATVIPQYRTEKEEHWITRHKQKLEEVKKGNIDLVLIGDSITAYGERQPSYQHYFGKRKALNLGFGGDRTQNVLYRLRNGEVDGLSPKLVVLLIGTNNSGNKPEDTVLGIQAILAELRQRLPDTKVLILSILPRAPGSSNDNNMAVNKSLPPLADGETVMHLDMNSRFLNADGSLITELFYRDLVHLSDKGYQVWWETMEPVVSAVLGEAALPPRQHHDRALLDVFPPSSVQVPPDARGKTELSAEYTPSGSLWNKYLDEQTVFNFEIKHEQTKDNSFQLRLGKGGQLYSLRGPFGESVPPQGVGNPWNTTRYGSSSLSAASTTIPSVTCRTRPPTASAVPAMRMAISSTTRGPMVTRCSPVRSRCPLTSCWILSNRAA